MRGVRRSQCLLRFLFLGQSIGVVLAASLIDRIGSSAVVALGGAVMAVEGVYFAWVLRRRDSKSSLQVK
jgi:YNFM family putative membrane transporter